MVQKSNTYYYVPDRSRMPILASLGLFIMMYGAGFLLNQIRAGDPLSGQWIMFAGFTVLAAVLYCWFATTIYENASGVNNAQLKRSYVMGMYWFIFTEVMFFFIFFFALFYVRNMAGPWLGGSGESIETNRLLWQNFEYQWPMLETPQQAVGGVGAQIPANTGTFVAPHKSMSFPGFAAVLHWLPLWNTLILLSSSFTVHIAHLGLKSNNRTQLTIWLGITVLLGMAFLALQYLEYYEAYAHYGLTLSSGIYGSTFFMLTGFHGFHVCMGAFMLLVMWLRTQRGHFSPEDHFGFEAASWYWHFVDVVWVCLFLFVYIL
jgi:cytochrome c oxidase subunit 3